VGAAPFAPFKGCGFKFSPCLEVSLSDPKTRTLAKDAMVRRPAFQEEDIGGSLDSIASENLEMIDGPTILIRLPLGGQGRGTRRGTNFMIRHVAAKREL
jgi:hypothetical protein